MINRGTATATASSAAMATRWEVTDMVRTAGDAASTAKPAAASAAPALARVLNHQSSAPAANTPAAIVVTGQCTAAVSGCIPAMPE